jgi:hypothetical protein
MSNSPERVGVKEGIKLWSGSHQAKQRLFYNNETSHCLVKFLSLSQGLSQNMSN